MNTYKRTPIEWLLYPGMQLMRKLRFPAKTVLMGLLFVLPLSWVTIQDLRMASQNLASTQLEVDAGPVVAQVIEAIAQTQKHRGLVNRVLGGDVAAEPALAQNRAAMKAAFDAVQASLARHPEFGLDAVWEPLGKQFDPLVKFESGTQAQASFQAHSGQIEAMRVFLSRVAEASGLLLDPDAAPFHLMHLEVEPMVAWTEALGQLRGQGAGLLRKGSIDLHEHAAVMAQIDLLAQATANAQMIAGALERSGETLPAAFARALKSATDYARVSNQTFDSLAPAGDATSYFDAGTQAIGDALEACTATGQRLQQLLIERRDQLRIHLLRDSAVFMGAVFLMGYLALAFFRTSFGAIRVLQGSVALLTAGDFAAPVRLRGTDELSAVANMLEAMMARLSQMVADIRSNSTLVAQAGLELAESTKSLSERTESQAANLEQTGASVQELSSAVRANALGSEAASERAANVRALAEDGGSAIQAAVASMQDIRSSSARVQEIVGVIEGIAFQTNILALNAAVEAARAGEQGRGFAVVASEVRLLAQRSAVSAREIKALIDASVRNVATGSAQIDTASHTFVRIVQGVREVAESVDVIQANTKEQSSGLDQIAQAVKQIDEITQRNAQMVESAFHSSSQLTERAERLSAAVRSFRLRQGSADEAQALVESALALYKSQGAAALTKITTSAQEFADRDMYVFAFDRQGVYRAFSGHPEKVGTHVSANPGLDADKLVREAFALIDHEGSGWVEYRIANPLSGDVDDKTSYVVPVTAELLLGCGVYKHNAATAPASSTGLDGFVARDEQRERVASVTGAPRLHAA